MLFQTVPASNSNHRIEALLSEIAAGNSEAIAELYELTRTAVYSFALSILKNSHDAEDAVQDCFLTVSAKSADYRAHGKPMAWMLTITKNLCLQRLRAANRCNTLPEEDWMKLADERGMNSVEDRLILEFCMNQLSDEERQIVVLHAVAGFKHREIAKMLDLALPTVLSKYNRALKKLKNNLERSVAS